MPDLGISTDGDKDKKKIQMAIRFIDVLKTHPFQKTKGHFALVLLYTKPNRQGEQKKISSHKNNSGMKY